MSNSENTTENYVGKHVKENSEKAEQLEKPKSDNDELKTAEQPEKADSGNMQTGQQEQKEQSKQTKQKKQKSDTGRFTPATYDYSKLTEKEKRNIEKYGNPHKLGFLRFLMIMFAFPICYLLIASFCITKDVVIVDFMFMNLVFDAIAYTVIFVMIWQRKKITRTLAIITLSVDLIGTLFIYIPRLGTSPDALSNMIMSEVIGILLVIYFVFSRRVKYALTRPLVDEAEDKIREKNYFNLKSWSFWRDLIIMFFVFSVVGHWLEYGYCTLIKIGLLPGSVDPTNQIWRNLLFPFPIYGAGAVACALMFYPLKQQLEKLLKNRFVVLVLVFVISGIVCTLMELAMGLCVNQDLKLWNYDNMAFNFMGQVCLQNSIAFALAATIMTYVIYPLVKGFFVRIDKYMNIVFIAVLVAGIFSFVYYYFNWIPDTLMSLDPDLYKDKVTII